VAIKAAHEGSVTSGGAVLGVRELSIEESIEVRDVTTTATAVLGGTNIVPQKMVQHKAGQRVSFKSFYGADGAGDPPAITNGVALYGDLTCTFVSGRSNAGTYVVEKFTDSFSLDDGVVQYSIDAVSSGSWTRT
jgi:hypothetical protein